MGGLLPVADASKNGFMTSDIYKAIGSYTPSTESAKFTHLFNLRLFSVGCFYLKFGNTSTNNESSCIIDINNRSQTTLSVVLSAIKINATLSPNLYAKLKSDQSIDVFIKQLETPYPLLKFSWIHCPSGWEYTYVGTVSDVSESELTKIL